MRISPGHCTWRRICLSARIEEVFEFVGEDCELSVEAMTGSATPEAVGMPAAKGIADKPVVAAPSPSIRVDVEKVDRLVNLVGELVINQAMLAQLGSQLPPDMCAGLLNGLDTMSQHLRELQEGVMAIRAQPVKSVFSRMPRLVRELSAQLGKEVRLAITGEGTEIDKTVIEQLADPLTHLLRNALDHGIELPDERLAAGKHAQGTIFLTAEHRGGRIVIEVADDGRGISRAKVLAKAQAQGLVPRESTPTDEEIDQLIFRPGFSTAEALSDVSGRGVGMDVVKRNIQALGGRIAVESRERSGVALPTLVAADTGDSRRHGGCGRLRVVHHPADQHHGKPAAAAGQHPSRDRTWGRARHSGRIHSADLSASQVPCPRTPSRILARASW